MTENNFNAPPGQAFAAASDQPDSLQFSIADLMVVTTIVGGLLGFSTIAPGWAVVLSCLAVAALFRAVIVLACYGTSTHLGRFWSKWLEFLVSFAIMSFVAIAGIAILHFGAVAAFQFGDRSGGGYVPKPVLWPFAISLLLVPTTAGLVLWFTRRASALLTTVFHTVSRRSQ